MSRPQLLDLFCGAGGAAVGYSRAGFDVIGVDIEPQPHYPFEFYQADALTFNLFQNVVAIHASPPCQHYTKYANNVKDIRDRYEDLIVPTRKRLKSFGDLYGVPYVIENVERAPLENPVKLCGSMFDLDVQRHRLFETNWPLENHPWPCRHRIWGRRFKAATGRVPNSRFTIEVGSWDEPIARQKRAMGVTWPITVRELSEAIPPAYTQFIGEQLARRILAFEEQITR